MFYPIAEENMSFDINNRRYAGCKNKLITWIFSIIKKECSGADSFFNIFAGTGVIASYRFNDKGRHDYFVNGGEGTITLCKGRGYKNICL